MIFSEQRFEAMKSELNEVRESRHFKAHFQTYDMKTGPGRTLDCVRGPMWTLTGMDAAEHLYRIMSSPPWNRKHPVEAGEKIPIYFVDVKKLLGFDNPFTFQQADNSAFIVLPCQCDVATVSQAFQFISAAAIHEATHVFNFTYRPFATYESQPWRWFDEGFCVFMENLVMWGNSDYFVYVRGWIDQPEIPLCHETRNSQAVMFVTFLAAKFGYEFINDVWTKAHRHETPLQTISRLLHDKPDTFQDVFMEYCRDGYFLLDPRRRLFAPEIYRRYGRRAVTESFSLQNGASVSAGAPYVLNHLGCRYVRFFPKTDMTRLNVRVRVLNHADSFRAQLAVMGKNKQCGVTVDLKPSGEAPGPETGEALFSAEISGIDTSAAEHAVLIVTNCGVPPYSEDTPFPSLVDFERMNGMEFTVEASAA